MHLNWRLGLSLAVALACCFSFVPIVLAAPSVPRAVPVDSAPAAGGAAVVSHPPYTHTVTTKVRVPQDACAKRKTIAAAKANDPTICTVTITSQFTDFIPSGATGSALRMPMSVPGSALRMDLAVPGSLLHQAMRACPSGDKYFTDSYTNLGPGVDAYQIQIITQFHWDGSCGQPTGTGPYCQVNWTTIGISQQGCYYWHSGQFNATEGKFLVWVSYAWVGYTAGVYRGCRPDQSCYAGWV